MTIQVKMKEAESVQQEERARKNPGKNERSRECSKIL